MKTDKYHIRFFRVGDASKGGDAIVIEVFDEEDNPHIAIIDGGYADDGQRIVDYLVNKYSNGGKNKVKVDYVFNTHPDLDHISGLKTVLESDKLKIGYLLYNRPWKDAGLKKEWFSDGRITKDSLVNRIKDSFGAADDLESLANKNGIKIHAAKAGLSCWNGILQVLGPSDTLYKSNLLISDKTPDSFLSKYNKNYQPSSLSEEDYEPEAGKSIEWIDEEQTSEINQTSIVLAFVLGDYKFLFTGDAGKDALSEALNYWESCGYEASAFSVVQLPHHGSRKNIDPGILSRLKASEYIISCPPEGMKEGHPSRRLINKILEMNSKAEIYTTADCSSFNFHKGVQVNYNAQKPETVHHKMDGKAAK